jgi:hypothetical protein
MQAYTFLGVSRTGSVPDIDLAVCGDDREAIRLSDLLFRDHQHCVKIEIWDELRKIAEILRPDASGLDAGRPQY